MLTSHTLDGNIYLIHISRAGFIICCLPRGNITLAHFANVGCTVLPNVSDDLP